MTSLRAFLFVVLMVIIFTGSQMWTRGSAERKLPAIAPHAITNTTSILDGQRLPLPGHDDGDWTQPRVDLNGNEIDAAIGDYRVDRNGEMYEEHSPETALLHLSAPEL
jgi:hypothetical protein